MKPGALYSDGYHTNVMDYEKKIFPQVLDGRQLAIVLMNFNSKALNVDNIPKTDIAIRNIAVSQLSCWA